MSRKVLSLNNFSESTNLLTLLRISYNIHKVNYKQDSETSYMKLIYEGCPIRKLHH